MEERTAFWQRIPKRPERIVLTIYGVIRVHADCLHLRQNWWKAACPLSGSDPRKRTFVQKVGQGGEGPIPGGKPPVRYRAAIAGKQPFVHVAEQG
jgi:hypothetical protein